MTHAKLYALADYLLLENLKILAAKRLCANLLFIGAFQPGTPAIDDVAMIARYVYANTNNYRDGKPEEEEPLRKFISAVIATNFKNFVGEGANQVFRDGGDLVMDICHKARAQTVAMGKDELSPSKSGKKAAPDVLTSSGGKRAAKGKGSGSGPSKTSKNVVG